MQQIVLKLHVLTIRIQNSQAVKSDMAPKF